MRTLGIALSLALLGGCVWGQELEPKYLPEPPGALSSSAAAINNRGQIVGTYTTSDYQSRTVLWEHGQVSELPLPEGFTDSMAVDINNAGVVVGDVNQPYLMFWRGFAFVWQKGQELILIPPPQGYDITRATRITDDGIVYGIASRTGGPTTYWENITSIRWTRQGGTVLVGTCFDSVADANTRGDMVGYVGKPPSEHPKHAVVWEAGAGKQGTPAP